ncbi:hypothetical protein [Rivularia sp. UHCC 0363]|uniref:hypothetical protein n=1 Tax=Rivularia sp. UHCC 0363 TaxID=3110244 RepID=UPI002B1F7E9C|nr:hypothetical protein [Rivularia sp. UHCC 0363]MEA5596015.1 hypothetical protein [Rivularia sp. UHCC 0363]
MKRTFFIIALAIFFTFDIFFAISTAVADNVKSSPNMEIMQSVQGKTVIFQPITDDAANQSVTESAQP